MGPWCDASRNEREAAFHEELNRLPRADRTAIILCGLEGRSIEQAARTLRWPVGRLERRLSRALERLRLRMARRYYGIPPGTWDPRILQIPEAIVPESLIESTVAAATRQAVQGPTRRTANPQADRPQPERSGRIPVRGPLTPSLDLQGD
jgi:Sigma-70, region 4